MIDFVQSQGARLLGTRIRRLSEAIDRGASETYRNLDIGFEPRWAAFMALLAQRGATTVTEAATELGQTHPAVVQVVNALTENGYVDAVTDPADARRRQLRLTAEGKRLVKRLKPVWDAIAAESDDLLKAHAPLLFEQLAQLESALADKPLAERFRLRLEAAAHPRRRRTRKT